ncbi:MAG: hypothetical protein AAGA65_11165 [Actinomycetota bacterium]
MTGPREPGPERLQDAVGRAVTDLEAVIAGIGEDPGTVHRAVRLNLDLQLLWLRTMQRELADGPPSRRVWSLGQAAVPVLHSLLNAVIQQAPALPREPVDRCRRSLGGLADALVDQAEGRTAP